MNFKSRWGWWLLTLVTAVWLLGMTMRPDNTPNTINLIPLAETQRALVCLFSHNCPAHRQAFWLLFINVLGNIVVFTPLGLGLAGILSQNKPWLTIGRATLLGCLFSITIELMQLTLSTRATDVDDVIFNTLGTASGAAGFVVMSHLKTIRRQRV